MTVLVIGGAGFMGFNFVYYILGKYPDYKILCVDCLTYAGNMSTLAEAMKNSSFKFSSRATFVIVRQSTRFSRMNIPISW